MNGAQIQIDSPAVRTYSRAAVLLHWLLAVALLAELMLGWWMLDLPKSPAGLRAGWYNLHKSIGLAIAGIAFARILLRRPPPSADACLPAWQRHVSNVTHALMYLCMLVIPLSGFLGSNFTRYPVLFFGMALPAWNRDWPAGKEWMSTTHYTAVWLFMGLVALHVAAALWHWLQRDFVCARMGVPPRPTLSRN